MAERCGDPLLDLILQKYIQASRDSIRGPVALKTDVKNVPKHVFEKHSYKNMELVEEESKLFPSNLDGYTVHMFSVGGEKRICFSELVQTTLKDVNVHEIFKKRDHLLIFCSKCTPKQMDELKYRRVLPWTTTSSNLITKSDAYRLVGALQGNLAPKADASKRTPMLFEVYHECFGGCIGVFDPEIYTDAAAACIRCTECNGLFTTRKFVSHNHTSFDEVHTCHWGFDSSRWRSYMMLVEQKASPELLGFWDRIKGKFDSSLTAKSRHLNVEKTQDADFVAYIHSPDHKKAMVSPIESLRNQEARSDARYESSQKEQSSAFRPWSPKPVHTPKVESRSQHFKFPSKDDSPCNRLHSVPSSNKQYHNKDILSPSCACCPTAPLYAECKQCTKAAHVGCHNSINSSDKTNEDVKPRLCFCEKCRSYQNFHTKFEGSLENIINRFTSKDNKLTTSTRDLANYLSSELKNLHISQDDRIHEIATSNQRLQTELQLVKMESQRKLTDARDTKVHVEQELETLHRERQKDFTVFSKIRSQLHQKMIDCENLKKQLDFYVSQRKTSIPNWTPYPTMARQFSDSEDEPVKEKKEKDIRDTYEGSPVNKSRKLEEEGSSSDIEVED